MKSDQRADSTSNNRNHTDENQTTSMTDEELIQNADRLILEERILEAAKYLRKLSNPDALQKRHRLMLKRAEMVEDGIQKNMSPPEDGWNIQTQWNGDFDTVIYYKIDDEGRLTSRIETPIESSLLIPLISVFNESELYKSWMPRYSFPIRLGLKQVKKLKQVGRCGQIVSVTVRLPWPFSNRELIYEAMAVDAIEEIGAISVKGTSGVVETDDEGNSLIPPPSEGVTRVDFDTEFLFRKCPSDHLCLTHSTRTYPEEEHKILISTTLYVDSHLGYAPTSLVNFVTRTVMGNHWNTLLHVAVDVREGKRPEHKLAIAASKELYDWVEKRIEKMFAKIEKENDF